MTTRRQFLTAAATLPVAAAVFPNLAIAGEPPVYQRRGFAIDGYDPVAYFTDADAVRGDDAHTSEWNGATFRFASAANKETFDADPETYAPQYGGYCAWAVANGYTAKIDPDAWSIENGKLYLNFSKRIRRRWLKDVPGNIAKGDANWPSVLG